MYGDNVAWRMRILMHRSLHLESLLIGRPVLRLFSETKYFCHRISNATKLATRKIMSWE